MRRLLGDERAQGLVEYAVVLAFIAVICVVALRRFGATTGNLYSNISNATNAIGNQMPLQLDLALLASIAAAASDLRTRKIPNGIPLAVAFAALGLAAAHGLVATLVALAIMVATLLLGTFAFGAGWLGGGDVKLLAAVNGCLGLADAVPFLVYTALCGGLIGLGIALGRRNLPSVLRSVGVLVRPLAINGTVAIAPERPIMMPYALAIAGGVITVALSHSIAPFLRLPL